MFISLLLFLPRELNLRNPNQIAHQYDRLVIVSNKKDLEEMDEIKMTESNRISSKQEMEPRASRPSKRSVTPVVLSNSSFPAERNLVESRLEAPVH